MKKYASLADYTNNSHHDKILLFQLAKANIHPSVVKGNGQPMHYPSKQGVLLMDEIYDKEVGRRRNIRYAEGVSSIFVDKQDKDIDLKKKVYKAYFLDGKYTADGRNPLVIDFLMKSDYNGTNPNRDPGKKIIYNFVDKGAEFKNNIANDRLEQKAADWCYNAEYNDVLAFARVVIGTNIETMDSEEIRWNMKTIAKTNPAKFLADIENPKIKRKHIILTAIDRGLLKVNLSSNTISWAENPHQPIATPAPVGVDVIDHFVNGTATPDGELVYQAIKEQVRPETKSAKFLNAPIPEFKKDEAPELKPLIHVNDISWKDLKTMYDNAVEKGIITSAKVWKGYGAFKIQGETAMLKALKGDKEMLENLTADLAKSEVAQ